MKPLVSEIKAKRYGQTHLINDRGYNLLDGRINYNMRFWIKLAKLFQV